MNNKAEIGTLVLVLVIVVAGVGAGGYVASQNGYLPWTESAKKVPTTFEKPSSDNTVEPDCSTYKTLIETKVPTVRNITYDVFWIDGTPTSILQEYRTMFEGEGYTVYNHEGQDLYGDATLGAISVAYGVFGKGITLRVILATESQPYGSCVLSAVGPIWDFRNAYNEIIGDS